MHVSAEARAVASQRLVISTAHEEAARFDLEPFLLFVYMRSVGCLSFMIGTLPSVI